MTREQVRPGDQWQCEQWAGALLSRGMAQAQCLAQAHNNPPSRGHLGRGHSLDVGVLEGGPRARARSPIRVSYQLQVVSCRYENCKLKVVSCTIVL